MLDEYHSTITPVGSAARFSASLGTAYYQLPAATIHLLFVYFSGRYKTTPFPLSSHLILRKLSLLWWIISSSVHCWMVERQSSRRFQAKCIVYSFLQTLDSESKHRILHFLSTGKMIMDPSLPPYTQMLTHTHQRTHSLCVNVSLIIFLCSNKLSVKS